MEPIQRKIMEHLRKQFAHDAPVKIFPEGRRCVVVTDAETGKVYGVVGVGGWIEVR